MQFFIGTYLKKKRKKILDKINGSEPDETLSNFSNLIELQLTRAIGLCSPGHSGLVQMKLLSNPRLGFKCRLARLKTQWFESRRYTSISRILGYSDTQVWDWGMTESLDNWWIISFNESAGLRGLFLDSLTRFKAAIIESLSWDIRPQRFKRHSARTV